MRFNFLLTCVFFCFAVKATETKDFGAWSLICGEKGNCSLSQLVATDAEAKNILLGVNVNFSISPDFPVLILRMPPSIYQKSGVGIKIDDKDAIQLPISQCNHQACQSVIKMDEVLLQQMKNGQMAKIAFALQEKKQLTLPVSLQMFSDAYAALESRQP